MLAEATPTRAEALADFPARPVTLVVPAVPSVAGDLLMVELAEVASRHLGQSIIPATKVPPCKSKAQCILAAAECSGGPLVDRNCTAHAQARHRRDGDRRLDQSLPDLLVLHLGDRGGAVFADRTISKTRQKKFRRDVGLPASGTSLGQNLTTTDLKETRCGQ